MIKSYEFTLLKKCSQCGLDLAIFVTGVAAMVAAQIIDPRGFWSWVWD
jgi:hypothetical protein